jgi:Fic family protein
MAKLIQCFWEPQAAGLSRKERRGGEYRAYVPDELVGRTFAFSGEVSADIADAERAISDLDRSAPALASTEALARLLLRAESVASSRIEGLEVGPRRLLRADAALQQGDEPMDATAAEVLGNIDAMEYAVHAVDTGAAISQDIILQAHRRLLAHSRLAEQGGLLRKQQNWIGGNDYNPLNADFVPPPFEMVPGLLEDLCRFSSTDDLPAVAQAAVAHAQFETIHPFVDGNGRVGRALTQMILRRRGLTQNVMPPVSLILATRTKEYIAGLAAMRYSGKSSSASAFEGLEQWLGTFAGACLRAAKDAGAFQSRITSIQNTWKEQLAPVRSDSAVLRLVERLPGTPVLSAATASQLIGRSLQATLGAIDRLVAAGILFPLRAGRQRGQIFEAREIIEQFTALERRLASPAGHTKVKPPVRPVPARYRR